MIRYAHRIGAVLYMLWGILHVWVGIARMSRLIGANELAKAGGAVAQNQFNLIWFGLFALTVGGFWNWNNSVSGYWTNLVVVSAADIGFIVFRVFPGHVPLPQGLLGPSLWILAVIFSTTGVVYGRKKEARSSMGG